MMTKRYATFLSAIFCAFIFGMMLLHLLLPDRDRSETENRTLQQRPELTAASIADGDFMEESEDYIADQFPGRDGWTGMKARVEQLLGKREFRGVYLCGDTLINRGDDPGELAEKNLAYVTALDEKTDVPVYLGLIPTASEVWSDKLPTGAASPDQGAWIASALEKTGLPEVDYQTTLLDHAQEPIYYRTDHHWTSLGAYYGYTALCNDLNAEAVNINSFTEERVTEDFNGTLYSTSGIHWLEPDTMEFYVPEEGLTVTSWRGVKPETAQLYDRTYLAKKDKYSAFLGGNQPLCVIKNDHAKTDRKILLVRDSYADAMAPFLAQTFEEVHLIDLRYYRLSVAEYADENEIDDIVISYSVQNFVTDNNLLFLSK